MGGKDNLRGDAFEATKRRRSEVDEGDATDDEGDVVMLPLAREGSKRQKPAPKLGPAPKPTTARRRKAIRDAKGAFGGVGAEDIGPSPRTAVAVGEQATCALPGIRGKCTAERLTKQLSVETLKTLWTVATGEPMPDKPTGAWFCKQLQDRNLSEGHKRFCESVTLALGGSPGDAPKFKHMELPDLALPHAEYMRRLLADATAFRDSKGNKVLAWDKIANEPSPLCGVPAALGSPCADKTLKGRDVVKLSAAQEFFRRTMVPEAKAKGRLLWHSPGSGKTCAVISTASSSFELQGWKILWVTRRSLKTDLFKDMFDNVCHATLGELKKRGLLKIPESAAGRAKAAKAFTPQWFDPITYREFGNVLQGKGPTFRALLQRAKQLGASCSLDPEEASTRRRKAARRRAVRFADEEQDGPDSDDDDADGVQRDDADVDVFAAATTAVDTDVDIFHKVLVVVDEAHNLIKTKDAELKQTAADPEGLRFTVQDFANMRTLLHRSYGCSGDESAKVVLMSATPVLRHAGQLGQLLNLIQPNQAELRLPETPAELEAEGFVESRGNSRGLLNDEFRQKVEEAAKGLISYLDVSFTDHTMFALPNIRQTLYVKVSPKQISALKKCPPRGPKRAECFRRKANFGFSGEKWPFAWMWQKKFQSLAVRDEILEALPDVSPKTVALLNTIRQLDARDMRDDGKLYKHAIYVADPGSAHTGSTAYGAAAIGTCLAAAGFHWVQEVDPETGLVRVQNPIRAQSRKGGNPNSNFAVLSMRKLGNANTSVLGGDSDQLKELTGPAKRWCDLTEKQRETLIRWRKDGKRNAALASRGGQFPVGPGGKRSGIFNDELVNGHGELIRFVVFDEQFAEGIDLKGAIKYLHVFSPMEQGPLSMQAEARPRRRCGQRVMDFMYPEREGDLVGWPLTVVTYKGVFDRGDNLDFEALGPFDTAVKHAGDEGVRLNQVNQVLNLMAHVALDRDLNAERNPQLLQDPLSLPEPGDRVQGVHSVAKVIQDERATPWQTMKPPEIDPKTGEVVYGEPEKTALFRVVQPQGERLDLPEDEDEYDEEEEEGVYYDEDDDIEMV